MMKAVRFEPGEAQLMLLSNEEPIPTLASGEVLLEVHATAVNRADTLQRRGLYPPPPGASHILGLEATGIIVDMGDVTTSSLKKGDRVMTILSGGGYAGCVAVHHSHLMLIPDHMTFQQAAAIPEVWLTAHQLITTIGRTGKADTVLVHAGASGIGTAAVQLLRQIGATVIVTVSSQSKADTAKQLGAHYAINYKLKQFDEEVLRITEGRGVDVILDCVGGSYWQQNANIITVDGRWVLYGLLGGPKVDGPLLSTILRKRVMLQGTLLRSRSVQYKADLVQDFTANILPLFSSGELQTVIDSVYPIEQIVDAHVKMESNLNQGKIILTLKNDDEQHQESPKTEL